LEQENLSKVASGPQSSVLKNISYGYYTAASSQAIEGNLDVMLLMDKKSHQG